MPAQPRVGAMIRRARQSKRMSQDELAQKLGVSRSAVNAWERDRAWPRNPVAVEETLGIILEVAPEPGPLDDLKPWQDEWEATVAGDPDLPVQWRRDLITDSRAARAAYAERRARRRAAERQAG